MHAPERRRISSRNLLLETRLVSKEFRAVEAVHREGFREGGFRDETIVDPPGFEEAGCVGGELEASLDEVSEGCGRRGRECLRRFQRVL